jgi:hypothetical protein
MEPVLILLPGLLGGLALALIIATTRRRPPAVVVSRRLDGPTPELINMAHIKVEGIGGLGLVAAVIAVALADPRIRLVILAAMVLGVGLALLLIYVRRVLEARSGGDDSADRSTLHLDGVRPFRRNDANPTFKDIERLGAVSW